MANAWENMKQRVGFIHGSGRQDFVGVDVSAARDYVRDICGTAIKTAISAAKNTRKLYNTLEAGWSGVAVATFEQNFAKAVQKLEKSLAKAFAALVKEIAAVTDAMVDQDINMVKEVE